MTAASITSAHHLCVGLFIGLFAGSNLAWWYNGTKLRGMARHDESKAPTIASTTTTTGNNENANDGHGWKTLDVFYGDNSIMDLQGDERTPSGLTWPAQVGQDRLVAALLGEKRGGYFVDLAANNAYKLSNTFGLERALQWKGLCIEANPRYWRQLAFRDCQVVAAVVGQNRMEKVKFALQNAFGGIVGDNFDNQEGGVPFFTVPLLEIFQRKQTPTVIDYFSLDVEGAEDYIMSAFPFDEYKFKIMTVERPELELCQRLGSHGYRMIKVLVKWGETMWVHEDYLSELDLEKAKPVMPEGPLTSKWKDGPACIKSLIMTTE